MNTESEQPRRHLRHELRLLLGDMRVALRHLQALMPHLFAQHVVIDLPAVLRLVPVTPAMEGKPPAPALRLRNPDGMTGLREFGLDGLPRDRRLGG